MIEKIAFNFLLAVYSFLGVHPLPEGEGDDWIVIKNWVYQPDRSYLLVIENKSIQKQCGVGGYIVFPQIYMGRVRVFTDGVLIFSNSNENSWNLKTTLNREVISCEYFRGRSTIVFSVESKIKYFNSISYYPYISKSYPSTQFFYEYMYLVSAIFCIFFGVIGFILNRKLDNKSGAWLFLIYNFSFSALLLCHIGFTVGIPVEYAHFGVMITLNAALFYFTIFTLEIKNIKFLNIFFLILLLVLANVCFGKSDVMQAEIVVFIPFAIGLTFALFVYKCYQPRVIDKILYFLIFVFVVKDCYMAQAIREGFLYLSMIIILTSIAGLIDILIRINKKSLEIQEIYKTLENERRVISKMTQVNDTYREIIHDLKSPLTAIDFFLKKQNTDNLSNIVLRIKHILNKVESEAIKKSADWYSVEALKSIIGKIANERIEFSNRVNFEIKVSGLVKIFFDPIDIEICVSELFDNSLRYAKQDSTILITIFEKKEYVVFQFLDERSPFIGYETQVPPVKGVSQQGSGIGLINLGKKINQIGGNFSYAVTSQGFEVSVGLKKESHEAR